MELIFLILAVLVVAFGIGVLVVSRSRDRAARGGTPTAVAPPTPPPRLPTTTVGEPPGAVDEIPLVDEVEAVEPEVVAPPATLRERMAKARAALAGAFAGVLGRTGITNETWDDLEEALLRTDVGVQVTDALLADLRARVKAGEITDPVQLLDALKADMSDRLAGADRSLRFDGAGDGSPDVWMFVGVN
ncbi:MAG TPA: signal recognition particle receptor subunit alpha, partial [Ilumatobacteraceae bacterium]